VSKKGSFLHFKFFIVFLITFTSLLYANDWQLENIYLQTENDADFRQDGSYTYGSAVGALYGIEDDEYISFAIAHQMYTPQDFEDPNLIEDDRPYAGYLYFQTALHRSLNNTLHSLTFQFGIVGPSAKMEEVQKIIHSLIGSPDPKGWQHQLKDEVIAQINYAYKHYYNLDNIFDYGYDASFIPNIGIELGNASINGSLMALFRWGKNVPKDYGSYLINNILTKDLVLII